MKDWLAAVTAVVVMITATQADDVKRLPDMEVRGTTPLAPALPAVEGARIFEGKKTTQVDLTETPAVVNNDYRQATARIPGLLISEAAVPAHLNQNYRGVGDPHESESVLTMKDGVPIVSDWFGYSTVYATPPFESVERIEFVRGGGALLYGPQPGPVVNYISYRPPTDTKFRFSTQQIGGSYDLYSTFNSVGGTVDQLGYYGYYSHVQSAGARRNADYAVDAGHFKLQWSPSEATRLTLSFDGYAKDVGEAGRLSLAQYRADRDFTRTPFDRIWIERYVPMLTLEHDLSEDTLVIVKTWGGYQDRLSRRQANSLTNNLDQQEFYFGGVDARLRHQWAGWDNDHTFTGGFVAYGADSPRTRERGTPRTATAGTPVFALDRSTAYGAVFGENLFRFGRLAVIPSVRLDVYSIEAREKFNTGVSRALIDEEQTHVVPLGGLGVTLDVTPRNQLYANVSTGYRPTKYDDLVNATSNTQLAPSDLEPSLTWTYEVGLRGAPTTWWNYDTSLFFIDYKDVIENRSLGGGDVERSNSGRAQYYGWEAATEWDVVRMVDAEAADRYGSVSLFGSVSLLSAEFVDGANDGKTPAYAPDYIVKTGLTYRFRNQAKVAFTGTLVDESFWQDSNAAGSVGTSKIAAYGVWDLTAEVALYKNTVTLVGGLNNVFDEDYYSRVRSDGIEPAARRNFYAGVKILLP